MSDVKTVTVYIHPNELAEWVRSTAASHMDPKVTSDYLLSLVNTNDGTEIYGVEATFDAPDTEPSLAAISSA
jgi:hypothetical protein